MLAKVGDELDPVSCLEEQSDQGSYCLLPR